MEGAGRRDKYGNWKKRMEYMKGAQKGRGYKEEMQVRKQEN